MHRASLAVHLFLLAWLAALEGCCAQKPRVLLSTPPDQECQTGMEFGLDIALWQCVDGEHVVAYRKSSAFFCSAVRVERVPCGQHTPLEQKSDGDACRDGHPVSY